VSVKVSTPSFPGTSVWPEMGVQVECERIEARFVQEALNNVLKDAQASEVWVALTRDKSRLQLVVEDNARGFTPGRLESVPPADRGLGAREIAEDRTGKEIAELLGCGCRTVESHRQRISQKLELSGSHSLLRFASDHKAEL
jgi:signal transduction histidine kinase